MRRETPLEVKGRDIYDKPIQIGQVIVFSWGGTLSKAIIEDLKVGRYRMQLTVRPLDKRDEPYSTTATVKDSRTVVII